jgi:hypothetical protein
MLTGMLFVPVLVAMALGWWLRKQWAERDHLRERLAHAEDLVAIPRRENDEQLARAKLLEHQLLEERARNYRAHQPHDEFEAHSEMPEKQKLDHVRVPQEPADPPQPRRRRGDAASSSACAATSDARDRDGEGIFPSTEPDAPKTAEPHTARAPEMNSNDLCPKCRAYFDKAVGMRGRVGGKLPIWIATKAGERYRVRRECGRLKRADQRFVKEHTGCYDCTFPRGR